MARYRYSSETKFIGSSPGNGIYMLYSHKR